MTPDLHDATLTLIEVDWVEKLATLTFQRSKGAVIVAVLSCSRLILPRDEPWGPSSSVNLIEVEEGGRVPVRLSIEMQSGDVILIEGEEIEWAPAEGQS